LATVGVRSNQQYHERSDVAVLGQKYAIFTVAAVVKPWSVVINVDHINGQFDCGQQIAVPSSGEFVSRNH